MRSSFINLLLVKTHSQILADSCQGLAVDMAGHIYLHESREYCLEARSEGGAIDGLNPVIILRPLFYIYSTCFLVSLC